MKQPKIRKFIKLIKIQDNSKPTQPCKGYSLVFMAFVSSYLESSVISCEQRSGQIKQYYLGG